MDYQAIRSKLVGDGLEESHICDGPFNFLGKWLQDVIDLGLKQPNAMCLSTVDLNNHPHSRVVLLKEIESEKLLFYTNYESAKSLHLKNNPHVALNFFWPELSRQVKILGEVRKVERSKSESYFNSRPEGSKIAANISPQSKVITSRLELEKMFEKVAESNNQITCPDNWGGFEVTPHEFEFWQGRENRLHDRIVLTLDSNSKEWIKRRKAP